ncbi:hypothetical protein TNCV_2340101 [Trichonephila clavipes]|nr:hypothetical protein TNCV_2340101 [Trichonephila clavipes]
MFINGICPNAFAKAQNNSGILEVFSDFFYLTEGCGSRVVKAAFWQLKLCRHGRSPSVKADSLVVPSSGGSHY